MSNLIYFLISFDLEVVDDDLHLLIRNL